jgi:stage IV sporulation protein FB
MPAPVMPPHIGRTAPTMTTLWAVLLASNGLLAVFNMLPAFPMDGGRVFRALLSYLTAPEQATRIAAVVGRVIAVGLFILGLLTPSPMLPFIALFIFLGAGAEVREAKVVSALQAIRAGDAVNPYAPRFTPATTVGDAVQALVFTPHPAFAVEHYGRLVGAVTREALVQAAKEVGPSAYLAGVMNRTVPVVQAHESLDVARVRMHEARTPFVAVVDKELFLGLVTELELVQQLTLAQALRKQMRDPRATREPTQGRDSRSPRA